VAKENEIMAKPKLESTLIMAYDNESLVD